jgi:nicotinamidase-related amidase
MSKKITHPSGIKQSIVDKIVARRGRLHAFETIDPTKTALIVVDLDTRTMEQKDNDSVRALATYVNSIASTLRSHGGTIAWVTTPIRKTTPNFTAVYGEAFAKMHVDESGKGGRTTTIWEKLDAQPEDIYAEKKGSSAFFPGNCNLHEQLQKNGIESLLIVGMVTNVCCEASARDAAELQYKVTMISDAMWGHKDGQHEATLATFFRNYGDVRTTQDAIKLISQQNKPNQ